MITTSRPWTSLRHGALCTRTCRWWCSGRGRHCASPIGHCAIGHWANREGRGARRRTRNELRDGEAERSRERAVEKTLTEMRAGALPDAAKCRARPFECKPSERGVASRRWPGRRHGNPRSLNGFGCRAGSRGTDETEDADETCLAKREMENPRRVSAINETPVGCDGHTDVPFVLFPVYSGRSTVIGRSKGNLVVRSTPFTVLVPQERPALCIMAMYANSCKCVS